MLEVEVLKELAAVSAMSGHEGPMIQLIKRKMTEYGADSVTVDNMGNTIALIEGTGSAEKAKIMVFAHMDEIGLIIRKIEDNGFIRIQRVGGVPIRILQAQPVVITTEEGEQISGHIGVKSHHLTKAKEKEAPVQIDELYVDIGASSKGEVMNLGIEVGNPITYKPNFERLQNGLVQSKAMDNRAGCFVLLDTLKRLAENRPQSDVYLVATVQEEFSIRGAVPAAFRVDPDLSICIDGSISCDTPDLAGYVDVMIGNGPVIGLYSFHGRGTLAGLIPHPALRNKFLQVADKYNIQLQRNVFFGGLVDSSFVQLVREGIPCVDVAFPIRYTHSPVETVKMEDLDTLARLVTLFTQEWDTSTSLKRG